MRPADSLQATSHRIVRLLTAERQFRLLRLRRVVTHATTRFVSLYGSKDYEVIGVNDPLGVESGTTTSMTHRQHLGHVLSPMTQGRYRFKRPTQVISIQTSDNDLFACRGQVVDNFNKTVIEELAFVDADHLRGILDRLEQL